MPHVFFFLRAPYAAAAAAAAAAPDISRYFFARHATMLFDAV